MRTLLLLCSFLVLPGCGALKSFEAAGKKAEGLIDDGRELIAKVDTNVSAADADGDGRTSWREIAVFLLGGGGLLGGAVVGRNQSKTATQLARVEALAEKAKA